MTSLNSPSELQKPISESRFSVIDMGDYREVPNPLSGILAQIYVTVFAVFPRMGTKRLAQSKMAITEFTVKRVPSGKTRYWAEFRVGLQQRQVLG